MEFVIDALLNNQIVQGLVAGLVGLMAWWGKGLLSRRQGRKQAREEARDDDVAAALDVNRRARDAGGLRDKPKYGKRDG